MRGLNDLPDAAQHRRIKGGIKIRHLCVAAIRRHDILCEIIGADAEKIRFLRQQIRDHAGGGCFDHHADLQRRIIRNFCGGERLLLLPDQGAHPLHFGKIGHQRNHQPDLPEMRRAQNRTQLCAAERFMPQAKAYRSIAQKRVFLFFQIQAGNFLIAADIQRSNNHRPALHCHGHPAVGLKLLLLIRRNSPVHEKKFRSEKADAFRIVFQNQIQIFGAADIGEQLLFLPVCRLCSTAPHLLQQISAFLILRLLLAVMCKQLRRRIDPHLAGISIQHHRCPRPHLFCGLRSAQDRRDRKRAR